MYSTRYGYVLLTYDFMVPCVISYLQSNFGSSNVGFSNPSESSKTAVGPEFSAIYFMHF